MPVFDREIPKLENKKRAPRLKTSRFRVIGSHFMKGKCRGTLLTRNSAKNRQKTGTDAKVTECSSAGCWQKWPKKAKSAGFGRGNETFLAGEAIFYSML